MLDDADAGGGRVWERRGSVKGVEINAMDVVDMDRKWFATQTVKEGILRRMCVF
jgi:hypothetical protein